MQAGTATDHNHRRLIFVRHDSGQKCTKVLLSFLPHSLSRHLMFPPRKLQRQAILLPGIKWQFYSGRRGAGNTNNWKRIITTSLTDILLWKRYIWYLQGCSKAEGTLLTSQFPWSNNLRSGGRNWWRQSIDAALKWGGEDWHATYTCVCRRSHLHTQDTRALYSWTDKQTDRRTDRQVRSKPEQLVVCLLWRQTDGTPLIKQKPQWTQPTWD